MRDIFTLCLCGANAYMMPAMLKSAPHSLLPLALAAVLLAGLAGIATAGWLGKGDQILFSMVQSGLAWCF